ncbi:MAG: DMT family transporter [Bacteriovoracia bacterium]
MMLGSWLVAAIASLLLYGFAQGLVKKFIADAPPARFCLYFVFAKMAVNLWFYLSNEHPPSFAPEGMSFFYVALFATILEGTGWILYYESIVVGPISIVGTLSAAYPALTVVFARIFLGEELMHVQYLGVALVIAGSLGLSYAPPDPSAKIRSKIWIPLAFTALVLWGAQQTIIKYSYRLPNASEVNLSLYNVMGGMMTLGLYGLFRSKGLGKGMEWVKSFVPMAMMAGGDLGAIIAYRNGPASIVAPITGAYPVVTLIFASFLLREKITKLQWLCVLLILIGMFLAPGSS